MNVEIQANERLGKSKQMSRDDNQKRNLLFKSSILLLLTLICSMNSFAQRASGKITGRIVADDEQPIPQATVIVSSYSGGTRSGLGGSQKITTDNDGYFVAEGLDPLPYMISAWAPGFAYATNSTSVNPYDSGVVHFAYVGESVTLQLKRGGVITGRVTNAAGDPVIGIMVRITQVQDESGRSLAHSGSGSSQTRTTDDRGIYRAYSLATGAYVVAAGGSNGFSIRPSPFVGRALTYHPSSTRDAAPLVTVSNGSEVTGIDIRYRDEKGFAVSGKVLGLTKANLGPMDVGTDIYLRNAVTGNMIATTWMQPINNQNGYAFYGIPNGEYELIAQTELLNDNGLSSTPRRISVRGADVTGIDLMLTPNAAISGTVILEKLAPEAMKCEMHRESHPEEIVVKARRDEPQEKSETPKLILPHYGIGVPINKGTFTIRNLVAGRHRIELDLPDESWYLKAMAMDSKASGLDPRTGLSVKTGDKITGLNLTVASGAASLKGRVTIENARRPARVRVHLIPAEPESKDEVLRFAETRAESNGSFTFTNLAPGKYLVTTRLIPDTEADDKPSRPAAWEATERTKLRKEAEAMNVVIELKPCQQVKDFVLKMGR